MDKSENRGRTRASTKRLDLTVVGGQNLGGASCYCELKYLPRSEKHAWAKTTKVAKTTNPAWNETWTLATDGGRLEFTVWEKHFWKDECLGMAEVQVDELMDEQTLELRASPKSSKKFVGGKLIVRARWHNPRPSAADNHHHNHNHPPRSATQNTTTSSRSRTTRQPSISPRSSTTTTSATSTLRKEDVRQMSITELKDFLDRRGVDHSYCIEKADLIELVLGCLPSDAPARSSNNNGNNPRSEPAPTTTTTPNTPQNPPPAFDPFNGYPPQNFFNGPPPGFSPTTPMFMPQQQQPPFFAPQQNPQMFYPPQDPSMYPFNQQYTSGFYPPPGFFPPPQQDTSFYMPPTQQPFPPYFPSQSEFAPPYPFPTQNPTTAQTSTTSTPDPSTTTSNNTSTTATPLPQVFVPPPVTPGSPAAPPSAVPLFDGLQPGVTQSYPMSPPSDTGVSPTPQSFGAPSIPMPSFDPFGSSAPSFIPPPSFIVQPIISEPVPGIGTTTTTTTSTSLLPPEATTPTTSPTTTRVGSPAPSIQRKAASPEEAKLMDRFLQMPVSELRKFLASKKINTQDCLEKDELVKKAVDSEMKRLEEEFLLNLSFQEDIPDAFIDCITQDIMIDPVFTCDGHTYESSAITQWLKNHDTSPKTGLKLENKKLIPNHQLRGQIKEWAAAKRREQRAQMEAAAEAKKEKEKESGNEKEKEKENS